jgi:cation diffusion facilitator family transporter
VISGSCDEPHRIGAGRVTDVSRDSARSGRLSGMTDADGESLRTVVVACSANLAIAVAKGIAALLTGSAALWAETAHSIADTGNQVLLFIGLQRSSRVPDRDHPFGYGQERFFWAFLAALGIFLIGGLLSIAEGVRSWLLPEPLESPWTGIIVLVVAAFFELISWRTALKQLRTGARLRRRSVRQHLTRVSDPSAAAVFLEDSAALVGLGLALAALLLHLVTGSALWDSLASVVIGLLLMVVAYLLARRTKALLVDESAPQDILDLLRAAIAEPEWVASVDDLQAVYIGPSQLLVMARVAPRSLDRPAAEVVAHAEALRSDLLANPAVTAVAITLTVPSAGAPPFAGQPATGEIPPPLS